MRSMHKLLAVAAIAGMTSICEPERPSIANVLDDDLDDYEEGGISGVLEEVGALFDEVGEAASQQSPGAIVRAVESGKRKIRRLMKNPPSPAFARGAWNLMRRSPAGFQTSAGALSASVGAGLTQTLTATVERPTQVDRLLLVPSAPGLVITSLKMGDIDQLLTPGVPVELYGTSALTDSLPDNFTPLAANASCKITLLNTTGATITCTLGFKAKAKRSE